MADALKSGKVFGYAFEGEDLEHGPLVGIENAIGLKGFGWYTKEALWRLNEIWIKNIKSLTQGKPQNTV
jgi:lactate dehydrogenase-like 2-hydroxyacid dehydrogenase